VVSVFFEVPASVEPVDPLKELAIVNVFEVVLVIVVPLVVVLAPVVVNPLMIIVVPDV
jgi:hypothetical protein